jgi:hypothetical protein
MYVAPMLKKSYLFELHTVFSDITIIRSDQNLTDSMYIVCFTFYV